MNIDRKNLVRLGIPALVVIVLAALYLRGRNEESPTREGRRADRYTGLFRFMTFSPDDETTLPLDPSKIDTYEIEEEKFIQRVVVEKDPVCTGEDFMVTVEASNPNGPDANLVTRIGNRPGNPAVLRFTRAGDREFYVVVRDEGKHIEYRKVTVKVRDCPDRPSVALRASLHATRPETGEFEVTETKGLSAPLSYEWDFGDGTTRKSAAGYAMHNYALREQNRFLSSFLARVTVTDGKRNRAEGRATLSLPNIHYVSKMMGSPIIPVLYNRFPEYAGGRYTAKLTMKNVFEEGVVFDEAEVEYRPCDSSAAPEFRSVTAGSLLGVTSIPAKGTVEDRLVFDAASLPKGTCNVIVKFTGRMGGDNTVTAGVYLDIPPRPGDASGGEGKGDRVVTDDAMKEKLEKAARILGKDRPITPDDIRRLEKEGKL